MSLNYSAVSEPWMRRMLLGIREHVAAVAAVGIPEIDEELAELPHFDLARTRRGRRVIERFANAWLYRHNALARFIEQHGITHVLCHYGTLAVRYLPLFERIDTPVFVHFHGYDATFALRTHDGVPAHSSGYRDDICRLSKKAVLIANSEYTRRLLVEGGVAEARVRVKHLGVEPSTQPRSHTVSSGVQVLFVGRLIDCKGPDLAIQAFDKAVSSGLDAEFTIVGDGPMRGAVEEATAACASPERIHLAGALPGTEVERYLQRADIYLQHNVHGEKTDREEAYGVSILEALARGIPALVTRSGGVPDVVGDLAGDLMSEPGDVEGQSAMLLSLGKSPDRRAELGRRCWEWARDHRSAAKEAAELRQILESGD